jgi:solute carrier family 9B (sodium/hydrogen exchanger), member 1/2
MFVNELIAFLLLFTAAAGGGWVASHCRMPPLLGMLAAGFLLRNLPWELLHALPDRWSVALRLLALTVILLRAGLGLDLQALQRLRGACLRLACLPNLAEAVTVAVVASVLLKLPLLWGLLLGFVIAAVSPAVVVPSLLALQLRGYGRAQGIPTMVLAAASFDDVISITGFGMCLSLVFGGRGDISLAASLLRAPMELLLGLGSGIVLGLACVWLRQAPAGLRFAWLLASGLVVVFTGWSLGMTGGGSLAAMTMGAVAARGWQHMPDPVAAAMGRLWAYAQPLLFGLIGAAVMLAHIELAYMQRGLIILALGLLVRLAVTYGATYGAGFTRHERLFIALAWLPKATVQAAVGALALDLARHHQAGAQAEAYGIQVLTLAVLAIICTAPIGALAIAWSGPRWLQRQPERTIS